MAEIVATPISAVMMSTDPWLPYLVGLAIILIFFPLLFLVPETIEEAREKARKTLATGDHHLPEALEPPSKGTLFATIYSRVQTFLQSTQFMWRNSNVLLTLLAVFVGILSKQSTSLLLQYASAKYHWSIARVSSPSLRLGLVWPWGVTDVMTGEFSYITARFYQHRELPVAGPGHLFFPHPVSPPRSGE